MILVVNDNYLHEGILITLPYSVGFLQKNIGVSSLFRNLEGVHKRVKWRKTQYFLVNGNKAINFIYKISKLEKKTPSSVLLKFKISFNSVLVKF